MVGRGDSDQGASCSSLNFMKDQDLTGAPEL